MSVGEKPGVYEIRVHGCTGIDEALVLKEPIARALCPDPDHNGPCEVPWSFTFRGDERTGDETTILVLAVYTSAEKAAEVTGRVRAIVGEKRQTVLCEGDPERFEELVEQYRIESRSDLA